MLIFIYSAGLDVYANLDPDIPKMHLECLLTQMIILLILMTNFKLATTIIDVTNGRVVAPIGITSPRRKRCTWYQPSCSNRP